MHCWPAGQGIFTLLHSGLLKSRLGKKRFPNSAYIFQNHCHRLPCGMSLSEWDIYQKERDCWLCRILLAWKIISISVSWMICVKKSISDPEQDGVMLFSKEMGTRTMNTRGAGRQLEPLTQLCPQRNPECNTASVFSLKKASEALEATLFFLWKETDAWVYCSESIESWCPGPCDFFRFQMKATSLSAAWFQLYLLFIKQTSKCFRSSSGSMSPMELLLPKKKLLLWVKTLMFANKHHQRTSA